MRRNGKSGRRRRKSGLTRRNRSLRTRRRRWLVSLGPAPPAPSKMRLAAGRRDSLLGFVRLAPRLATCALILARHSTWSLPSLGYVMRGVDLKLPWVLGEDGVGSEGRP